jgi:plastin-1
MYDSPVYQSHSTQQEMMGLISQFRNIDVEEKGSVDKQSLIKSVQDSGEANYDQVRETLKEVNLDSSGRVELEDYVDVSGASHFPR